MSNSATPSMSSLPLASVTQSRCCWYCGRGEDALSTKLQKCEECGLAEYCNLECQRGDWNLHKVKCKRLTEIVVDTDVKNRLRSGALKRRLLTLSEGTVILTIRDPDTTTIGDMNLALERVPIEAPFFECNSLLRVDLKGCTKLTSVGTAAFARCSSLTFVALPDSLTQIGKAAFEHCSSLTSVVLPDSLTQLDDGAFSVCSSLTSVVLPDSLTQLGFKAFARCSSLTSVVLPDSITRIFQQSFDFCSSLTSVVLPDSLTQLDMQAFCRCTSLTSVVLPESLTQINKAVFGGCPSLTSVVLPDRAELGDDVFLQCDALVQKAALAGFDSVELYLRDRYKSITQKKLVLRLFRKYNKAVNNADGTEAEKHASALALFPPDNSGLLEVGLFLQKMNISGGDGVKGLVGYILEFV